MGKAVLALAFTVSSGRVIFVFGIVLVSHVAIIADKIINTLALCVLSVSQLSTWSKA